MADTIIAYHVEGGGFAEWVTPGAGWQGRVRELVASWGLLSGTEVRIARVHGQPGDTAGTVDHANLRRVTVA